MTTQVFVPPSPLQTAVLFLVFNRPDTTKQVFEAIRQARPPRLYVAADGAREGKQGEAERVEQVRKIATEVDWPCKVKTLFRDKNLGCKYGVSSAITWFFQNEEQGIILEDDCLPTQSFFWFCEKMLGWYKSNDQIMMIAGTNYLIDIQERIGKKYFFSRHYSIWGWATWRRAWASYDVELDDCKEIVRINKDYNYLTKNYSDALHYESLIANITNKAVDTWDFQWVFNCIYRYGLCLTPSVNLVENLGVYGVHSNGATENNFLKKFEIDVVNLEKERWILPNMMHDDMVSARNHKVSLLVVIKIWIKKVIKFFQ